MPKVKNQKLFWILNLIVLLEWIFFAFGVKDRMTWVLENMLLFLFVGPIVYYYLKDVLSTTSYVLIAIFVFFHNIGAHYTYSEVPYNQWTEVVFGTSLNDVLGVKRNHYDRLVHFLFGFLLTLPVIEFFEKKSPLKGLWLISYAILLHIASSSFYEAIEWVAALVFGEGTGTAYLGTQGDPWDAHKDVALATAGSVLGLIFLKVRDKKFKV